MSKRGDEEALKDIFLRFVEKTEGNTYEVVGENVSNRTGTKNFDYLLRARNEGGTMALEITLVSDNEHEFEEIRLKDSVLRCIEVVVKRRIDELHGAVMIETPHRFYGAMRTLLNEAECVALKILETAKTMAVDEEAEIGSPIGSFKFRLVGGGGSGVVFCSVGQPTWATHSSDVDAMTSMLGRRLTNKNQQLDANADRRVILIGRMPGIIDREAIADALAGLQGEFPNVGELYVCYGDADIMRYW